MPSQLIFSKSENLFRKLFEACGEALIVCNQTGVVIDCNDAALSLFACNRQDLLGTAFSEYSPKLSPNGLRNEVLEEGIFFKADTGETVRFEIEILRLDCEPTIVGLTLNRAVVDGIVCYVLLGRDITEQKRTQKALRESENQFRSFFEHAPVSTAIIHMDTGKYALFNKKSVEWFGYTPDDIQYIDQWWELAYPDEIYRQEVIEDWTARVQMAIQDQRDIEGNEYRVTCKDGSVKAVLISGSVIGDNLYVLLVDISARRHAEKLLVQYRDQLEDLIAVRTNELKVERERLELALAGANLGVFDIDLVQNKVEQDERWSAMVGYSSAEMPQDTDAWWNFIHPEDEQRLMVAFLDHLDGVTEQFEQDFRYRHKFGHWVWLRSLGRIVSRDEAGKPTRMIGGSLDVTAQKRMETEGKSLLSQIEVLMRSVTNPNPTTPTRKSNDQNLLQQLSRRQLQVCKMIAKGLTSAEIATQLGLGKTTVVTHRQELMKKLNVKSAVEVTQFAARQGLLET